MTEIRARSAMYAGPRTAVALIPHQNLQVASLHLFLYFVGMTQESARQRECTARARWVHVGQAYRNSGGAIKIRGVIRKELGWVFEAKLPREGEEGASSAFPFASRN